MRVILASQRWVRRASDGGVREALSQDWVRFWRTLDTLVVPACSGQPANRLFEAIRPSALLLTGGNDLAAVSNDALSAGRDAWERELLHAAIAARIPVIGICRGMQSLLARRGVALVTTPGHAGEMHSLLPADALPSWVYPGWLSRDAQASYHRWGAFALPETVQTLARSEDGVVEACFDPDVQALGLMWHPERTVPPDKRDQQLLLHFLEQAA